jgi:PIN domain nuclease of toxin-antitoxin system
VLDASTLLAFVNGEPCADRVAAPVPGAAISTVTLSEVVAKLSERGASDTEIRETLDEIGLDAVPFDGALAFEAGFLRPGTRQAGLSLGDRVCLALARHLDLPALTTDRAWSSLQLGISVEVIR